MDAVVEILKGLDYSPLYVSLKTGIVATIFSFFLGLFAARRVIKAGPKVKAIADGILTLPMVLPPTAAGFFLLLLFSRRRPFGILLYEQFGIKVVQTWAGCIIAATVIAFPLMYRNARAAFEQIDDLCCSILNKSSFRYKAFIYFLSHCTFSGLSLYAIIIAF